MANDVFVKTRDDDTVGPSIADKAFLEIMEYGFEKTVCGNWTAPLPFNENRPKLHNNFIQAYDRAQKLQANLENNPTTRQHFLSIYRKDIRKGACRDSSTIITWIRMLVSPNILCLPP